MMMERISSVTSGPVQPSPSLCHRPRHYRAIPNTMGTRDDGTPPHRPLYSSRSPVNQTLELAYGRRPSKNSSTTTLEATLDT
jgi:hypothetical protein